jgi:hypothetical protein
VPGVRSRTDLLHFQPGKTSDEVIDPTQPVYYFAVAQELDKARFLRERDCLAQIVPDSDMRKILKDAIAEHFPDDERDALYALLEAQDANNLEVQALLESRRKAGTLPKGEGDDTFEKDPEFGPLYAQAQTWTPRLAELEQWARQHVDAYREARARNRYWWKVTTFMAVRMFAREVGTPNGGEPHREPLPLTPNRMLTDDALKRIPEDIREALALAIMASWAVNDADTKG